MNVDDEYGYVLLFLSCLYIETHFMVRTSTKHRHIKDVQHLAISWEPKTRSGGTSFAIIQFNSTLINYILILQLETALSAA